MQQEEFYRYGENSDISMNHIEYIQVHVSKYNECG